jgi:hypothetical protein
MKIKLTVEAWKNIEKIYLDTYKEYIKLGSKTKLYEELAKNYININSLDN